MIRQSIPRQIKVAALAALQSWQSLLMSEQDLRYLKYSQSFKVCLHKILPTQYTDHKDFFDKVRRRLQLFKECLYEFVFEKGMYKSTTQYPEIEYSQAEQSKDQFEQMARQKIGEQLQAIFQALNNNYSSKRVSKLRASVKANSTNNECDPTKVKDNKKESQQYILEALSINTFCQLVGEIKKTRDNIENARKKIHLKVIEKTSPGVGRALLEYSKTHPETQFRFS